MLPIKETLNLSALLVKGTIFNLLPNQRKIFDKKYSGLKQTVEHCLSGTPEQDLYKMAVILYGLELAIEMENL